MALRLVLLAMLTFPGLAVAQPAAPVQPGTVPPLPPIGLPLPRIGLPLPQIGLPTVTPQPPAARQRGRNRGPRKDRHEYPAPIYLAPALG